LLYIASRLATDKKKRIKIELLACFWESRNEKCLPNKESGSDGRAARGVARKKGTERYDRGNPQMHAELMDLLVEKEATRMGKRKAWLRMAML